MEWMPIESAPMDGTEFLGYNKGRIANSRRIPRDDCELWVFGKESGSTNYAPWLKPTHWMPLPPPPKEQT